MVDTATHAAGYPRASTPAWQTLSSAKIAARADALHTMYAVFVLSAPPPAGSTLRVQFGVGTQKAETCVAAQTVDRVVELSGAQSFDVSGKRRAHAFDPGWNCVFARTLATEGDLRYDEVYGLGVLTSGLTKVRVIRLYKRVDVPRGRWVRIPVYAYRNKYQSPTPKGMVITASGPGIRSRPTRMSFGFKPNGEPTTIWGFARVRLSGKGPRSIQITLTPSNGPARSTNVRARTHRPTTLRPGRYASKHPERLSFRVTGSGRVVGLRERLRFGLGGSGYPFWELIRFPSFRLHRGGWTLDETRTRYGLQRVAIVNALSPTKAVVTGMLATRFDTSMRRLVAHRVGR